MNTPRRAVTILIAGFLLPGGSLAGQVGARAAVMAGRVLDRETRQPLAHVVVEVPSQDRRVETDSTGAFRLDNLRPQIVGVRLRSIGYQSVERSLNLFAGRVTSVEYLLVRSAERLPEVVVAEESPHTWMMLLEGFEERRKMGAGTFYTEEEIQRQQHRRVPDLLRDAPGIRLIRGRTNEFYAATARQVVTSMVANRNRGPCFLDIIVDGNIAWSADAYARGNNPPDLSSFVSLSELVGVEVYQGIAGMPVQYRRHASQCGAILFWTKRGGYVPDPTRRPPARPDTARRGG